MIKGTKIGGVWNEVLVKVKKEVKNFYKNRFIEKRDIKVRMVNIDFSSISREDNVLLIKRFSEDEIKAAIWDCESSKSPWPDDFNFNFVRQFWDTIKVDIIKATNHFHSCGR